MGCGGWVFLKCNICEMSDDLSTRLEYEIQGDRTLEGPLMDELTNTVTETISAYPTELYNDKCNDPLRKLTPYEQSLMYRIKDILESDTKHPPQKKYIKWALNRIVRLGQLLFASRASIYYTYASIMCKRDRKSFMESITTSLTNDYERVFTIAFWCLGVSVIIVLIIGVLRMYTTHEFGRRRVKNNSEEEFPLV